VGAAWAQVSVLTQHNDNSRAGANLNETALTTANVNVSSFGKLFSMPVDGFVFAQPLYMPNVTMPNLGTHNVLFVATAHDSVYAFDADSGAQLWKVSLGTAVPNSVINGTNILVEVGIISTPVIDPSTNTLYVVPKTYENSVQIYRLHALDILTGAEKLGGPIQIGAQYPGSGVSNDGAGHVLFVAAQHLQRSALTLVNGVIYLAFASHEDRPPYHGWVLAYSAANLKQLAAYNDTPNSEGGGIWMSGQGLVADGNNNVYLITGNSEPNTDTAVGDYGESFLKLGLSGNALSRLDFFKANNYHALNLSDVDLGSGGPVAIPGTAYIIGGGKQGVFYLVDTNNMGKLNSTSDQVVQEFQATNSLFGSPVFWNNPSAPTLYVWGVTDSLKAFTYNFSTGKFNTTPASASSVKTPSGYNPCGALSVSSNQSVAGTGILWATIPLANPDQATVQGKLYAFDATNVSKELWDSGQNVTRDAYGNFAKFCPPTVANGKVYVATDSLQVCAYGLNPPAPVWHHRDISALATAPLAAGDPAGYVLTNEIVVYRGTDNHVHQLSAAANQGPWSHADLTALTNAPNAPLAAGDPSGYVKRTQLLVVYRGTDNDVHQLYTINNNTQWVQADLSRLASAPAAAGDPFGSFSPGGNQIVDYLGMDGHIHQLYPSGSQWLHADLTALTKAPLSAGDPFEYLQSGNQLVPFKGVDSDIHELYTINGQWVQTDLSKLVSAAPAAAGDPFGLLSPGGNQIVDYLGTDGHIHQLYPSGSQWLHADLTALTKAPLSAGDPFEFLLGGNQIVVFRGLDSDIHQVYTINSDSQWVQADLSKSAGAPPAVGNPFAYTFGSQVVVYRGTDGDIHLLSPQ
jgi:outer membrane protein assembly factor BamB